MGQRHKHTDLTFLRSSNLLPIQAPSHVLSRLLTLAKYKDNRGLRKYAHCDVMCPIQLGLRRGVQAEGGPGGTQEISRALTEKELVQHQYYKFV